MLDGIDLSRKLEKAEYKKIKGTLDLRLAELQRRARELGVPVMIVFEGAAAAGKGSLINELILPLDPRGFDVFVTLPPTEEESLRPFLWRFWHRTPARGRMAVFDRSWNHRLVTGPIDGLLKPRQLQQAVQDIRSFERQLADGGNVIVKFYLHLSKKEQKRRFKALQANPAMAWRITEANLRHHKHYEEYVAAADDMLVATDADYAPWTVVEAHDHRFATVKIFNTLIAALERAVAAAEARQAARAAGKGAHGKKAAVEVAGGSQEKTLASSILDKVDLSRAVSRKDYDTRLKKAQEQLRELEHQIYLRRIPVVIAYEGWDAAGKGGNIKRLTQHLDPRGYSVIPIAAPNDVEKAHHYLWRFWTQLPKAGHLAIFDRTWYGRVLVERVEGFCSEAEWRRAYREINEMEQHLTNFGSVLLKFFLHISPAEQLERFTERRKIAYKQWKITDEDWRNREKMPAYRVAVEEMLLRTSTRCAPWTVVESNDKHYARIKVLETVCAALRKAVKK